MKNIFFLAVSAIIFSATVQAQSTADSIQAKYKLLQMPQALTIEKTFPVLGTYQLNTGGTTAGNIVITLDSSNKGIVWIDGLPEGRMKAYLRKSPATYRIISQKTESGKEITDGTLIFNPDNNTLNISLGAPYNDADPNAIFALNTGTEVNNEVATAPVANAKVKVKTKSAAGVKKTRVIYYTATKTNVNSNTSSIQQ